MAFAMVEVAQGAALRRVWDVQALLLAAGDALMARFAGCAVRGELSGFTRAGSGHCYFSLKDASGGSGVLRCAMFRRSAALLDFAPADGQAVELRGRLAIYEARGELQFVAESMRRAGAGTLLERFLQLKARLAAEGLFDSDRKRALPRFPRRIGVVTSLAAAALHDVTSALARRAPHVEVLVYPCAVQGPDAPPTIVDALRLAAERSEVDVLIMCRGGGSLEDLWAFNDESVVRALARMPMPTVCGVGHETDVSLADFAADLRAPTPTAAAELTAPATAECLAGLATLARALRRRMHERREQQWQRLDSAALRLARPGSGVQRRASALTLAAHRLGAAAQASVQQREVALDQGQARLVQSGRAGVARQRHRLESLEARLHSANPRRVLERGYAWVTDDAGCVVQSVARLVRGQALLATLADGRVGVQVTSVGAPEPPS